MAALVVWWGAAGIAAADVPVAPVVGADNRLRVEVELIGDGSHGETRVLNLDLSRAQERRGGAWLGALGVLGAVPALAWLLRRLPRPA